MGGTIQQVIAPVVDTGLALSGNPELIPAFNAGDAGITSAATGGNIGNILESSALAGGTAEAGQQLGPVVGDLVGNPVVGNALTGAALNAGSADITGGDPLLAAGMGSGTSLGGSAFGSASQGTDLGNMFSGMDAATAFNAPAPIDAAPAPDATTATAPVQTAGLNLATGSAVPGVTGGVGASGISGPSSAGGDIASTGLGDVNTLGSVKTLGQSGVGPDAMSGSGLPSSSVDSSAQASTANLTAAGVSSLDQTPINSFTQTPLPDATIKENPYAALTDNAISNASISGQSLDQMFPAYSSANAPDQTASPTLSQGGDMLNTASTNLLGTPTGGQSSPPMMQSPTATNPLTGLPASTAPTATTPDLSNTFAGANAAGSPTAAPQSSVTSGKGGFLNSLLADVTSQDFANSTAGKGITSGLSMLPSAGMLGASALLGTQPVKGTNALNQQAQQLSAQAAAMQSYLQTGQLPPGVQGTIDQAAQAAKTSIKSQYAASGQTGSSAESQALSQVDANAVSQAGTLAMEMFNSGLTEAGMANQLYTTLLQQATGQDTAFSNALSKFATAAAGGSTQSTGTGG